MQQSDSAPFFPDQPMSRRMRLRKRFGLFITVLSLVFALALAKIAIHWTGLEFLNLNALFTSVIAGAVFIIGFLLSAILTDYKEAERMPADIRASLEAIFDDCRVFAQSHCHVLLNPLRDNLLHILQCLPSKLGETDGKNLRSVIHHIDFLTDFFGKLETAGMPPNYVVRLRAEQTNLRKIIFRMYHMQRIQFLPSVHVLVQSLVIAVVTLLLFLKTEGSPESALIFGAISYMFIYVLHLAATLEQPFRKGRHTLDDVSLFLLRECHSKIKTFECEPVEANTKAEP